MFVQGTKPAAAVALFIQDPTPEGLDPFYSTASTTTDWSVSRRVAGHAECVSSPGARDPCSGASLESDSRPQSRDRTATIPSGDGLVARGVITSDGAVAAGEVAPPVRTPLVEKAVVIAPLTAVSPGPTEPRCRAAMSRMTDQRNDSCCRAQLAGHGARRVDVVGVRDRQRTRSVTTSERRPRRPARHAATPVLPDQRLERPDSRGGGDRPVVAAADRRARRRGLPGGSRTQASAPGSPPPRRAHRCTSSMRIAHVRVQLDGPPVCVAEIAAAAFAASHPFRASGPRLDAHTTIWGPSRRLWEFFHMRREADGWHAAWGGAIDHVSQSPGYYTTTSWPGSLAVWGASATSLPVAAGLITIADLRAWRDRPRARGRSACTAGRGVRLAGTAK